MSPDGGYIPRHIAIIMDGNRRWAKHRFITANAGHRAGAQNLRKLAEAAERVGVEYLTVYAFSTENWARAPEEVEGLMKLLRESIEQYINDAKKNDMRMTIIGDREGLNAELRAKIGELEAITRDKKGLRVVLALNYGSRDEIMRAVKKLCDKVITGATDINDLDERVFAAHLDTCDIPDPELLIRTGGEMRVSNFLLWQSAYTEFYCSQKLWPDFHINDLMEAISVFRQRDRRFGGGI